MGANIKKFDEQYMYRALSLAIRGSGSTSPNPMVGCVIVADKKIIGTGWHHKCGEPHAEVEALNDAVRRGNGGKIRGSTVYVTLEPCCHQGRTPPCAQRLVSEGVARVVVAVTDPNPKVAGGGLTVLNNAGIEVALFDRTHELAREALWINRGFMRVHTLGRPWVCLKAAVSLDGRMALSNGDSKWITGEDARTMAHELRASHDAILVGVGTVLSDDPELTVRHVDNNGRNPRRVILDSTLRTPPDAKVVTGEGGCIILTTSGTLDSATRAVHLMNAGAKIIKVSSDESGKAGRVDLKEALQALVNDADEKIQSVMVEGGPRVLTAFIQAGLADELALFVAPRILGEGPGLGTGLMLNSVQDSINLRDIEISQVESEDGYSGDLFLRGRFACSPDL